MAKPTRPTNAPASSAPKDEAIEATIATIAQTHLGLETLESRHQDRLDFQEHACYSIRNALRAAFEAGRQAARSRTPATPAAPPQVIHGDIILTADPRAERMGWTVGRIGPFRFCAKVFAKHADQPEWEIGRSRISKLELRRNDTGTIAFNWDRGLDVPATDPAAKTAVERLAKHLANHRFGPATTQ